MHLPGFLADRLAHDGGNALGMVKVDVGDAATWEDADDADRTNHRLIINLFKI